MSFRDIYSSSELGPPRTDGPGRDPVNASALWLASTIVAGCPSYATGERSLGLLTPESRAAARVAIEEKYLAAPNAFGVIVGR